MTTKQKVEKIIEEYTVLRDSSMLNSFQIVDKIDLLYRKEMEREIKGMRKSVIMKSEYPEVGKLKFDIEGFDNAIVYNQALQDVIDLISHKKDK